MSIFNYLFISMIRNSSDWYKKSKYNHKYDLHLCAYSALLRVVAKFHEDIYSDTNSPSGLNQVRGMFFSRRLTFTYAFV